MTLSGIILFQIICNNHNYMNRFCVILSITICCFLISFSNLSYGQESQSSAEYTYRLYPKSSGRPNAPARYYIECRCSSRYLELVLPPWIESVDISIAMSGGFVIWTGYLTSDKPYTDLPLLFGEYTITCVADDSSIFTGSIYF